MRIRISAEITDWVADPQSRMAMAAGWASRCMLPVGIRGIPKESKNTLTTGPRERKATALNSKAGRIGSPAKSSNKSAACTTTAQIAASIWIREWGWASKGKVRSRTGHQFKARKNDSTYETSRIITALSAMSQSRSGYRWIMEFIFASIAPARIADSECKCRLCAVSRWIICLISSRECCATAATSNFSNF